MAAITTSADLQKALLESFDRVRKPWQHQEDVLRLAAGKKNFGLFMEVGTGKTFTCILLSRFQMHHRKRTMKTLILCPPIVVQNWKAEWLGASKFTDKQILCATGPGKKRADDIRNGYDRKVLITNYESLLNDDVMAALKGWGPEILVLDECFHGDSLVDTPKGPIAIRDIRVGDEVKNCMGVRKVKACFKKEVSEVCKVKFNTNEEILTTPNHLFLTEYGWKEAGKLVYGDKVITTNEAMSNLRGRFPRSEREKILREILLSEMEDVSARNSGKGLLQRNLHENCKKTPWEEKPREFRKTAKKEPYVDTCRAEKSIGDTQKNEMVASTTGREWSSTYRTGKKIIAYFTRSCLEFCCGYKTLCSRLSYMLQSRFGVPKNEISSRNRWVFPQLFKKKRAGQEENKNVREIRVESCEIYKQGSIGFPSESSFYDLEIEGHPSYSIKGLVVHNCHRCKSPSAKRAKLAYELSRCVSVQHRYILSGTPVLNSPLDLFQQFLIMDLGATFGTNFFVFRNTYFVDKNAFMPPARHFPNWQIREGALEDITKRISDSSVSIKKSECLTLPPLVKSTIRIQMTPEQKRIYSEISKDFIAFLGQKAVVAKTALTKGLRLMQIASGFASLEGDDNDDRIEHEIKDNPKDKALAELLEDVSASSKAIVWCAFRRNYRSVAAVCEKLNLPYVQVHGGISQKEKDEAVASFNKDPKVKVIIGNAGSMGEGVNLTASNVSIFYSRTFSLGADIQAEARNFRGGSEVHDKVTRFDLVMEGTIEEHIAERLASKEEISETILKELVMG